MKQMKDTLGTVIMIVVGIVVAALVALWIYNTVVAERDAGNQALAKVDQMNNALMESDITIYDGSTLKGSQVINAIRNFESQDTQIHVLVNNGNSETAYCYDDTLASRINSTDESTGTKIYANKADLTTYINPSANFTGTVVRDEATNTIIALKFTLVTGN